MMSRGNNKNELLEVGAVMNPPCRGWILSLGWLMESQALHWLALGAFRLSYWNGQHGSRDWLFCLFNCLFSALQVTSGGPNVGETEGTEHS